MFHTNIENEWIVSVSQLFLLQLPKHFDVTTEYTFNVDFYFCFN